MTTATINAASSIMPASFNVEETLQSIPPNFEIPIIPFSELSYERALNEFFIPNIPFVVTGVTGSWSAQRNWIRSSDPAKKDARERAEGEGEADDIHVTGKTGDEEEVKQAKEPSWDYLSEEYGDLNVDVLQCPLPHEEQDNEQGEYGSGDIEEMKFDDVIKLWKEGKGKGMYIKDWHLRRLVRERNRRLHARKSFEESDNEDVLSVSEGLSSIKIEISKILKEDDKSEDGADEHKSEHDTDGHEKKEESFYTMPDIVKNDWMDNYYTNNTDDDFSFVYFGTKGTFTPLHRDVYTSYSWSANILGRKSWTFIAPSSIPSYRLYPSNPNSPLHPDLRPGHINTSVYPSILQAQIMQVIQEEGSLIYVPSNWYHCVENLDDYVISINQNWGNEINLVRMFGSMKEEVGKTEDALSDVKEILWRRKKKELNLDVELEWEEEVQKVLVQNVGWGWETFYAMIEYNLLHPSAPPHLRPPRALLQHALSTIFVNHAEESKKRTRARSYDAALSAALKIINDTS